MKRKKGCILCSILIFSCIFSVYALPVQGQLSVSFKVSRVVWGENPDSPTKAYPGDKEVPLTIEVQNLSPDHTIKGVSAILNLEDSPFTDVYGNHNATATGKPTVGEVLSPTDEIQPKGFFTLTFTLDIDSEAIPGSYSQDMTMEYSVESERQFVEGTPQTLTVELVLSKTESTITVSVSPQTVEKDEAVKVSGSIDPVQENVTITLTYKKPDGSKFNSTVKTNADGSFSESYRPDIDGFWSVNASWLGNEKYEGDWASTSFEVRLPVSLSVLTSDDRLRGGLDNQFNITILNSGNVSLSALDATLNVPSPLIVHGNNHWTFSYLEPGNSVLINVKVYAPESSIGATYSGSLNLNYRDDYGDAHTESYPIGLIIVGRVELVIYGKTVSPQPAKNGSKVSFAATLLNKGNVAAMYVNASILPSKILDLTTESAAYIGEVEENSPAPFTLTANIEPDVENGTYPLTVNITYRDDQYVDHSLNVTIYLTVKTSGKTKVISGGTEGFPASPFEVGLVLLTMLGASAVTLLLYRRHLNKQRENLKI